MSDIVIPDGKFVEVFTDLISEYTEEIVDATSLETGEKAYTKATDILEMYEQLLKADGNYHPDVGGRGGFYTNARVKIGHWRHQMHTILAHSYPSVAS